MCFVLSVKSPRYRHGARPTFPTSVFASRVLLVAEVIQRVHDLADCWKNPRADA